MQEKGVEFLIATWMGIVTKKRNTYWIALVAGHQQTSRGDGPHAHRPAVALSSPLLSSTKIKV
jgi:hypothetical protein